MEREKTWNKWKKKEERNIWDKYKIFRNEYVKIRREEASNFGSNMIEKCKSEPKLFYRYINGRIKTREGVDKLKV